MPKHIHGLDALKTLAILGVTFFHIFPDRLPGGYLGVSFFFVITGYLLAYTSVREWQEHRFRVLNYYWKRIKRIYPLLVLFLLTTIGVFHLLAANVVAAVRPEVISILFGYNNWWQIAQNADYFTRLANMSPFTHMWFLGVELQYYLVWPLLFGLYVALHELTGRKAAIGIFALLSLCSAAVMPVLYTPDMDVTRLYYGTDARVYALLFGAAMGLVQGTAEPMKLVLSKRKGRGLAAFLKCCVGILCMGIIGAAFLTMDGSLPVTYQGGMLGVTIVFCILLHLIASPNSSMAQCLDEPVFSWLGKHSYGIFLWQYPVIYLFQHFHIKGSWVPLQELAFIILLTIWSETLVNCLANPRRFFSAKRSVAVKAVILLLFISCGGVFAGYGCYGLAVSASQKSDVQTELAARLEQESKALKEQKASAQPAAKQEQAAPQVPQVSLEGAICIGDSVMLGSASEIMAVMPNAYVDAETSRYVSGGLEVAEALQAQGQLGDIVVVALGTNGPISGGERYEVITKRLMEVLGPSRHIFWVNTYAPHLKWQDTNNEYLLQMAAQYPNLTVIDWYSLVSKHPEWLSEDDVHPNDDGTVAYAKLIHDSVLAKLTEEAKQKQNNKGK